MLFSFPLFGEASDDYREVGLFVLLDELLDGQFVGVYTVDLIGAVEKLLGRVAEVELTAVPLRAS